MADPYETPGIDFHRPRDAGDVLSDSIAFLREHFVDLGRGLLYIVGPVLLLIVVASSVMQTQLLGFNPLFNPDANPEDVFALFGPAYFMSIGLSLVAWTLLNAVGFAYVFLYIEGGGNAITVAEIWERTKQLLANVLFTSLGLFLLILVSMLIFIIPCLGVLAWMAGWVYLFPAVNLVIPARLIDENNFFSAFRRARHLVEGYWGQSFGVVLLVGVVVMVVALGFTLPMLILTYVFGFHGAAEAGPLMRGMLTVGTALSALAYFSYALIPVSMTMHYYNLVTKQEGAVGTGLEDRIEAIGQGDSDSDEGAWDEDEDEDVDRWK